MFQFKISEALFPHYFKEFSVIRLLSSLKKYYCKESGIQNFDHEQVLVLLARFMHPSVMKMKP